MASLGIRRQVHIRLCCVCECSAASSIKDSTAACMSSFYLQGSIMIHILWPVGLTLFLNAGGSGCRAGGAQHSFNTPDLAAYANYWAEFSVIERRKNTNFIPLALELDTSALLDQQTNNEGILCYLEINSGSNQFNFSPPVHSGWNARYQDF